MICTQISLIQYKNHKKLHLNLHNAVVCISGANGSGKTNILDAIYYSAYTKSSFSRFDAAIPHFNTQGFSVNAYWQNANNQLLHIKAILRETAKKELYCNNVIYKTLHKHIGLLSAVLIAPEDIALINQDAQVRRKFIDSILCQTNTQYLQAFLTYQKILQQRNAFLKLQQPNPTLLQTFNDLLIANGQIIYDTRVALLTNFIPNIISQYAAIALNNAQAEAIAITYSSAMQHTPLAQLINNSTASDFAAGRTTQGPHKDDIIIQMQHQPFKTLASQGQKKSMLFAFKMAEFYYIAALKNDYPILLLDDVFEKLDNNRLLNLINALPTAPNFQLIVTDTNNDRLAKLFTTAKRNFLTITLP